MIWTMGLNPLCLRMCNMYSLEDYHLSSIVGQLLSNRLAINRPFSEVGTDFADRFIFQYTGQDKSNIINCAAVYSYALLSGVLI